MNSNFIVSEFVLFLVSSFPPHRVIVRQGHRGENYYIVVKGRVEVSVIDVDPLTREIKPRTVNILTKGQAFGVEHHYHIYSK